MTDVVSIQQRFKEGIVNFFDELIELFPEEGDLICIRVFLSDQIPIKDVINIFNLKMNQNDQQLRRMVKNRNEVFFLEHNLFDTFGKDKVNHFKRLWRSGALHEQDKQTIWSWIDALIRIGDAYSRAMQSQSQ